MGREALTSLMQMLQNFKSVSDNFGTFIEELAFVMPLRWYNFVALVFVTSVKYKWLLFFFKKSKFLLSSE